MRDVAREGSAAWVHKVERWTKETEKERRLGRVPGSWSMCIAVPRSIAACMGMEAGGGKGAPPWCVSCVLPAAACRAATAQYKHCLKMISGASEQRDV